MKAVIYIILTNLTQTKRCNNSASSPYRLAYSFSQIHIYVLLYLRCRMQLSCFVPKIIRTSLLFHFKPGWEASLGWQMYCICMQSFKTCLQNTRQGRMCTDSKGLKKLGINQYTACHPKFVKFLHNDQFCQIATLHFYIHALY